MRERLSVLLRPALVVGGIIALVSGVTYAQLTSSATLASVSESTASAGLNIWNGSAYASSAPGFAITNLIPGTGMPENVYLQNSGGVPEIVTANVPTLPSATGFTGWNNATVTITAENTTTCTNASGFQMNTANASGNTSPFTVNTNLEDLNAGNVILPCIMNVGDTGNSNVPGTPGNYDFHFDIAESSITGSQASIGSFPIDFTGTQTP